MFDMHKLLHFRTLARTGSFNSAAAELNLTQPSLSRSIQALEKQYGVQLIERQRGRLGIQLTQSGHQVLKYADQLLQMGDSMERELTGQAQDRHPTLSFGLGPMLASAILETLLDRLYRLHPGLDATIVIDATSVMYPRLLSGELEFYIGQSFGQRTSNRVVHTPFAHTPPRFYVRAGHALAGRSSVPITDLTPYPRITGSAWNDSLATLPSDDVAALRATLRLDNYDILARVAASTDSVLITSYAPRSTGLVTIPVEFTTQPALHQVDLYSLAGIGFSPVAVSALKHLKELTTTILATSN